MGTLSTRPHFWASSVPWGVTRGTGTQTLGGRTGGVMGILSSPCPFMLDPAPAPSCWTGASTFPILHHCCLGEYKEQPTVWEGGFWVIYVYHNTYMYICLLVGKPERNSGGTQFVFVRHHSVKRRRLQLVKVLLLWEGTLLFFLGRLLKLLLFNWKIVGEFWTFFYIADLDWSAMQLYQE